MGKVLQVLGYGIFQFAILYWKIYGTLKLDWVWVLLIVFSAYLLTIILGAIYGLAKAVED